MTGARLKRLDRLFDIAPLYFVTLCTDQRRKLLASSTIHEAFTAFARAGLGREIFVGRYVIMPDHLHVFVRFSLSEPKALSAWVKSLKNALSKTMNQQGAPAPHWQKGFFDHVLRADERYSEKWRYMVDNPVRAGWVTDSSNWPYQGEIYPLARLQ